MDEFQDTNRVQLEILDAIDRDNRCVVGDTFQSIYRFRHADVELLRGRARAARPRATRELHLSTNFRSAEPLLDAINAAVGPPLRRRVHPAAGGSRRPRAGGRGRAGRAAVTDTRRLEGRRRARAGGLRRDAARLDPVARRRGAPARPAPARAARRRPVRPRRRGGADARHGRPAAVRARARGGGRADLPDRRARVLRPSPGPRPAWRGWRCSRTPTTSLRLWEVLASPHGRPGHRRPRARRRRGRARRAHAVVAAARRRACRRRPRRPARRARARTTASASCASSTCSPTSARRAARGRSTT